MNIQELLLLIQQGESHTVEFKTSAMDITKDIYETICAFTNRDGGHVILGVKDNGTITGIAPERIEKMKKNFITSINNANKIYPPLYLTPIEFEMDGKKILYINVPVGTSVCRSKGRIFDRNHDSDLDITDNEELVYKLYARKQSSYFVNKVYTYVEMDSLRADLLERARRMTRVRTNNHSWLSMSDNELLRSAGLILTDPISKKEGLTLAAILLFGKDNTIMSVLPQHKTDAIVRIINKDRYDDRDVIITNLIESYDRLMAFGQKHLSDPFILEGILSVSARDAILREIISNSLAHRDYSSGYIAKFVIEEDKIFTENGNQTHGFGNLNIANFKPFPKNPSISKIFREIGFADELGSGMRNTYKYTKLYSGGTPEFIEDDVFTTIIPLSAAATIKTGPKDFEITAPSATTQASDQASDQANLEKKVLDFCKIPRTRSEIQILLNLSHKGYFRKKVLDPLIKSGLLKLEFPDKPTSPKQRYYS